MTNISPQKKASFPKLDRVIRTQRRMMNVGRFVTLAFVVGAIGAAASTVSGCSSAIGDDEEQASETLNRESVESSLERWGTPLPASVSTPQDNGFDELRRDIFAAMPDATFEVVDVRAIGDTVTATIEARGTLRAELMGLRATGAAMCLRFEATTSHDAAGRILFASRRIERAQLSRRE